MTLRPRDQEAYRQARRLRAGGMPFRRIGRQLGVSLATVHAWARDIHLSAEQLEHNHTGPDGPQNPEARRRRAEAWAERCRLRRTEYQEAGRIAARAGDPLHLTGCMLYWAEGSKKRNRLCFSNSDPRMMRVFTRFLTDSLGIARERICLSLNAYTNNGLSIEQIESFWLDHLRLPQSTLRKHTVNHLPTSSSGQARNRLVHGVCTLAVHSTRDVQHIYGAIQEYAGFEEPRWLG